MSVLDSKTFKEDIVKVETDIKKFEEWKDPPIAEGTRADGTHPKDEDLYFSTDDEPADMKDLARH